MLTVHMINELPKGIKADEQGLINVTQQMYDSNPFLPTFLAVLKLIRSTLKALALFHLLITRPLLD